MLKPSQALRLLLFNAALAVAAYLVLQELAWRSAYANLEGFSTTTGFSLLVRMFSMSSPTTNLPSPWTLDWVQVILLVAAVVDVWLLVGWYQQRKKPRPA